MPSLKRSSSTPDAALCPLPEPVTRDAAPSSLTTRACSAPGWVAHPNARETSRASGPVPVLLGPTFPPRRTARGRAATARVGPARQARGGSRGEPSGTTRPPSFASGRARRGDAHARPAPERGGRGERDVRGGGARTHPARGSRAGRCVGRGRARVTCTPSGRRLLIGL